MWIQYPSLFCPSRNPRPEDNKLAIIEQRDRLQNSEWCSFLERGEQCNYGKAIFYTADLRGYFIDYLLFFFFFLKWHYSAVSAITTLSFWGVIEWFHHVLCPSFIFRMCLCSKLLLYHLLVWPKNTNSYKPGVFSMKWPLTFEVIHTFMMCWAPGFPSCCSKNSVLDFLNTVTCK